MIKLDLTLNEAYLFYRDQNDVGWCADDVRRLRRQAIGRSGCPRKLRVEISCHKLREGVEVRKHCSYVYRTCRHTFELTYPQVEMLSPLMRRNPRSLWVRFV